MIGELFCKNCGGIRKKGRKLCNPCNSLRTSHYYSKDKRKEKNSRICPICEEFKPFSRKKQPFCLECFKKSIDTGFNGDYERNENQPSHYHRTLAENVLGRVLLFDEVVHHVDENTKNNMLSNLWVMNRVDHGKLHLFLRISKMFWLKANPDKCWKDEILNKNNEFVEQTNSKIIRLGSPTAGDK